MFGYLLNLGIEDNRVRKQNDLDRNLATLERGGGKWKHQLRNKVPYFNVHSVASKKEKSRRQNSTL